MNTEIPDNEKPRAWVFYDGDCRYCTGLARRFERVLARRDFAVLPLQTPWVQTRLNLSEHELLAEMRLLRPDGMVFGGADAVVEIARNVWWLKPLSLFSALPGAKRFLRAGYRWIARHRVCTNGACRRAGILPALKRLDRIEPCGRLEARPTSLAGHSIAFIPLLILPTLAFLCRDWLPAWVFMWTMAFALFAGCKWLTFWKALRAGVSTTSARAFAYLLAWPGMDAKAFLRLDAHAEHPPKREWVFAIAKTLFGVALVWGFVPREMLVNPLLAGWLGMIGVVFLLHFGVFHLLSLAWRRAGVNATPLMRCPIAACSLADFWGRRWNTGFHELAHRFAFRPLLRTVGVTGATLVTFFASGLVHELVISLPAAGGYGLPTGYFLIQGIGIITERTHLGRQVGLGRGTVGWLFMVLVTAGPAIWLFHPWFVRNVILPMLHALGAT